MVRGGQVLRRRDELELKLFADGHVLIRTPLGEVQCPHVGLDVLSVFDRPRTLSAAVEALGQRCAGREDWIEMTGIVVRLREAGVLIPLEDTVTAATHHGFTSPSQHVAMLNDGARTQGFIAALNEQVGPDDVVLEIGAGSGVLSIAAARAGARHVYAIEGTSAADWAEHMFEANGVADRVTLLRGWSTGLTLPEPATLLVTETVGNEALEEGILEWVIDARRRKLITEDARIVPGTIRILAVAVSLPAPLANRGRFAEQGVRRWRERYGIEFGPLLAAAQDDGAFLAANPMDVLGWQAMTGPVELATIDLAAVQSPIVRAQAVGTAVADGVVNAAVLWFDLGLGGERHLARSWDTGDPENSWATPTWILPTPIRVTSGSEIEFSYRYRVPGVARQAALRLSARG